MVTLRKLSKRGSHSELSFGGGEPSLSTAQYPSAVTFKDGGEPKIRSNPQSHSPMLSRERLEMWKLQLEAILNFGKEALSSS